MSTVTVGELTKHVDNRDQSAVMNVLHVKSDSWNLTKHVANRDQFAVMNVLHVNSDSGGSYQGCR